MRFIPVPCHVTIDIMPGPLVTHKSEASNGHRYLSLKLFQNSSSNYMNWTIRILAKMGFVVLSVGWCKQELVSRRLTLRAISIARIILAKHVTNSHPHDTTTPTVWQVLLCCLRENGSWWQVSMCCLRGGVCQWQVSEGRCLPLTGFTVLSQWRSGFPYSDKDQIPHISLVLFLTIITTSRAHNITTPFQTGITVT